MREIAQIIEESLPAITYNANKVANNDLYDIRNFKSAINIIDSLQHYKFIQPEIKALKDQLSDIYNNKSSDDVVRVSSSQYQIFSSLMTVIKQKLETVVQAVHQSITDEPENAINIKVPDYDDLSKLSKFFNDLNSALTMTVADHRVGGKVEVKAFESGSLWLTVWLGAPTAVALVSQMAHAALNIKKKYYEIERTKKELDSLDIQNDVLRNIEQAQKVQLDTLVKAYAHELINKQEGIANVDPEFTARIEKSLEITGRLFYEGAEFHKALNAPRTEVNNFPQSYNQLETEAGLKLLTEQQKITSGEETNGNAEQGTDDTTE